MRFVGADVADAVVEEDEAVPDVVGDVVGRDAVTIHPLPCDADKIGIFDLAGQLAGVEDRGAPVVGRVVPLFKRVSGADELGAVNRRNARRGKNMAPINGVCARGFD